NAKTQKYSPCNAIEGLLVAKAHCPICQSKYLAWVDESNAQYVDSRRKDWFPLPLRTAQDAPYFDLSYLYSFNDEPDREDGDYDPATMMSIPGQTSSQW
ncbi:MAG: hypothetical protein CEN92_453, partial [Candidatus Berkelbacteria bacterium Licking1014_96]